MEPQSTNPTQVSKSHIHLGILLLVAVVLGYFLYQRINPSASIADRDTGMAPKLTSEEQAVLNYLGDNMSEEEWNNFLVLVTKLAMETNTITIGKNCSVSPVVVKTSLVTGKKVTVRNTDTVEHTIAFNDPPTYPVSAGGTAQISVDFGGVPGIYSYGCDNSSKPVGLIQVLH